MMPRVTYRPAVQCSPDPQQCFNRSRSRLQSLVRKDGCRGFADKVRLLQGAREVQGATFAVPGARCQVPGARCEVPSARRTVQGACRKVRGARCEVRGARGEVREARRKVRRLRGEMRYATCEARHARRDMRGARCVHEVRRERYDVQGAGAGGQAQKVRHGRAATSLASALAPPTINLTADRACCRRPCRDICSRRAACRSGPEGGEARMAELFRETGCRIGKPGATFGARRPAASKKHEPRSGYP
jgi:hypothetical protein